MNIARERLILYVPFVTSSFFQCTFAADATMVSPPSPPPHARTRRSTRLDAETEDALIQAQLQVSQVCAAFRATADRLEYIANSAPHRLHTFGFPAACIPPYAAVSLEHNLLYGFYSSPPPILVDNATTAGLVTLPICTAHADEANRKRWKRRRVQPQKSDDMVMMAVRAKLNEPKLTLKDAAHAVNEAMGIPKLTLEALHMAATLKDKVHEIIGYRWSKLNKDTGAKAFAKTIVQDWEAENQGEDGGKHTTASSIASHSPVRPSKKRKIEAAVAEPSSYVDGTLAGVLPVQPNEEEEKTTVASMLAEWLEDVEDLSWVNSPQDPCAVQEQSLGDIMHDVDAYLSFEEWVETLTPFVSSDEQSACNR